MASTRSFAAAAGLLAALPTVLAGFDPSSTSNVAVYWGQNSIGQVESNGGQTRLGFYCDNADIDIINVGFLNGINPYTTNFANAGDNCTAFPDSPGLLDCPQIGEDIKSCQEKGKTIILSLGGATYNGGGFASAEAATTGAQEVWAMFGPNSDGGALRPFGDAVVDGFDYDFESPTQNMVPFGVELRRLMDAAGDKSYYLAAAPQCVFPDAANNEALDGGVSFDFIQIQFYNNWCGVVNFVEGSTQQTAYNFDVWDQWAASTSLNPNVKVLVGFPAREGAGGGYVTGSKLTGALQYSKTYSSFGGAMMWDMSQLYANDGFLAQVVSALG